MLTNREEQVLQVVRAGVARRGYPPSIREIGDAVGLKSTSSVAYHLKALERKGILHRDPGRPRTVELLPPDPSAPDVVVTGNGPVLALPRPEPGPAAPMFDIPSQEPAYVPWVGHIAAGGPILAKQLIEDTFPLPKQLVGEGEHLILQVRGDSMIDAAITNGDWVVVRRQEDADNGDIVAATFEGQGTEEAEATVKTFKRVDGHVWLIPHNPQYTPIPGDDAKIIGKVVSVLRRI
ncbi:MAG TPA: transcriptional repressor LexA [Streptosporangiaceae bacterium]|nr:transcriptional repressor LexA [Streptosporangiaceae bacterium]